MSAPLTQENHDCQDKWLRDHKWLKFDKEKQFIFCDPCLNGGRCRSNNEVLTHGCNNPRSFECSCARKMVLDFQYT